MTPADIGIYAAAVFAVLAVAVMSCGLPAWRASRVEPDKALRVG